MIEVKPNEAVPQEYSAKHLFSASHPGFEGHFPGFPLLPAVSQIDLVKDLIELCLKDRVRCRSLRNVKFKAMLRPDTEVTIKLQFLDEESVRWTLSHEKLIFSSGIFTFSRENKPIL